MQIDYLPTENSYANQTKTTENSHTDQNKYLVENILEPASHFIDNTTTESELQEEDTAIETGSNNTIKSEHKENKLLYQNILAFKQSISEKRQDITVQWCNTIVKAYNHIIKTSLIRLFGTMRKFSKATSPQLSSLNF